MRDASSLTSLSDRQSRLHAASANLRRQIRIRNILLGIVSVEALAFIAIRSWSLG